MLCENQKQDPNLHREEYESLLKLMQRLHTFAVGRPLFKTDADPGEMWEAYLSGFTADDRQHHNCSACRHFIKQYGGVVVVNDTGRTLPAFFDAPRAGQEHYNRATQNLFMVVERAKIVSGFKAHQSLIGTPVTGPWSHFHICLNAEHVERPSSVTESYVVRTRENFKAVSRFLGETKKETLQTAVALLKTDALYRSEKALGAAEWLLKLYDIKNRNLRWVEIAKAPEGFCHPRASIIGSLIEDIESGFDLDTVKRRFDDKMHPLKYQRPQAAPKAGAIDQAEKLFKELGLESALKRRFARVEEVDAIWRPNPRKVDSRDGIFAAIRKEVKAGRITSIQKITAERFVAEVLPIAEKIEVPIPSHGDFVGILTAEDPDAKPILQWDPVGDRRNPFSWFQYHGGSPAHKWSLTGTASVTAIVRHPSTWWGGQVKNNDAGFVFLLSGARHTGMKYLGLFPENLKSELHGVRSVIEAYSNKVPATGETEGSACGIAAPCVVDVTMTGGITVQYNVDRLK